MTTPSRPVVVVPMRPEHADGVLAVLAEGIATGHATFETRVPTWSQWDAGHLAAHRFVALEGPTVEGAAGPGGPADDPADGPPGPVRAGARVLGWVAVSPVSARAAYRGVVEQSVYVAAAARGRGVGAALVRRLLESCDAGEVWTVQSSVLAQNTASLALHDRLGFRRVGVRERVAQRDGRWCDVVLLERRSSVVGVPVAGQGADG